MSYLDAFRSQELTPEEMKGTTCTCPETGNPDEYGDGSSLPCMTPDMGMFGQPVLTCKQCIYCKKNKIKQFLRIFTTTINFYLVRQ